jgi:hypothetical protein
LASDSHAAPGQVELERRRAKSPCRFSRELLRELLQVQIADPATSSDRTEWDEGNLDELHAGPPKIEIPPLRPMPLGSPRGEKELRDLLERLAHENVVESVLRASIELHRRREQRAHGLSTSRKRTMKLHSGIFRQLAHEVSDRPRRAIAICARADVFERMSLGVRQKMEVFRGALKRGRWKTILRP